MRSGGRRVRGVEAQDGFMRWAGCEAGYRAASVAAFVGCPELVQQPFGHFAMNLEQRRMFS